MGEAELKKKIFENIKDIVAIRNKNKEFTAGKTKINYAGRVYDENEIISLVDASLEFWLTSGRYSNEFEKNFCKNL